MCIALMTLVAMLAGMPALLSGDQSVRNEEEGSTMHTIRITFDEGAAERHAIIATLEDNATTRDFMALLPLALTLKDYASTEKVADLPGTLSTQGAPAGFEPATGDLTYYAPWGNLAIFYRDFSYSRGLVHLGRITDGLEHLHFSGSRRVTIARATAATQP
ncbi:hypothetical protein A167_00994 [Alcanivorax sp. S71-1-4]|uniref:cyclophilin-like fold protein n=1 Tax=Alcanivorax sp. S71-1-4 TaxID=1177159 RepID=UPI0016B82D19|nr:cyclophilin-like fold protein [Alcanivorax sp. S71-1-4]KAF0810313.1 hypothetical protein A167_00994 [Alcanivorax sp. S71-1-4]